MAGLEFNFEKIFATATARSFKLAGQHMRRIVEGYRQEATNPGQFQRINQLLASQMHASVLAAYQSNVLAESIGPYRVGDPTRLSGHLLEALKSPTMAIGTATGIGFIDEDLLDSTARHWKRLNFGAGPAQGSLPRPRARVQFGSNQGFSFSLPDAPRPNFSVPESPAGVGYFLTNGQFYPGRPSGRKEGVIKVRRAPSKRGIGARRFLDAGLVTLGAEFRPAYKAHFEDASRRAASKGRRLTIT